MTDESNLGNREVCGLILQRPFADALLIRDAFLTKLPPPFRKHDDKQPFLASPRHDHMANKMACIESATDWCSLCGWAGNVQCSGSWLGISAKLHQNVRYWRDLGESELTAVPEGLS